MMEILAFGFDQVLGVKGIYLVNGWVIIEAKLSRV